MSKVVRLVKEDSTQQANPIDSVVFTNAGEIDMRAVSVMGMSAKQSDNAIGYFGTGLKYAIAVLLRNGMEVRILSGEKKYIFKKKKVSFRDSEFELITMNGKELPFTTELGKNWEIWQAYRELYCNCTDEGGEVQANEKPKSGLKGYTIISVTGEDILEAHDRRALVILDRKAIGGNDEVDVCKGSSHALYYKGIKVYDIKHSLYTYNLKCHTELTEDRTLKYWWRARGVIMNMILRSSDKSFIKDVITAPNGSFEADFSFTDTSEATATPSVEFLEVAADLDCRQKNMNRSAAAIAKRQARANSGVITPVKNLTERQKEQLNAAINLANKAGFNVESYPIVTTDVFDSNCLGFAYEDTIYVSTRAYDMGTHKLSAVLIEEFIHLYHDLKDESRAMQNFLFDKVVGLASELND